MAADLSRGAAPCPYSELWYMLQYMMQLQINYRDVAALMPAFVSGHRERYAAAAGSLPFSFDSVLQSDFCSLKAAVGGLATLQFDARVNECCL